MQETILQFYKSILSTNTLASHQIDTNLSPGLLRVQAFSDLLTGIAFLIIPVAILYFFYKRKDLRFSSRRMLIAGLISVSAVSAVSHFLDIYFLFNPIYWLDVGLNVATTVISISIAIILVRILPEALKIQSPDQLQKNALVHSNSYEKLKVSQESLLEVNQNLEGKVSRRNIELKKNEETLRIAAIVFESQDAMFVTDANKYIIRVNQALTFVTGYSEKELIGKNPNIFNSGKHDHQFFTNMSLDIKNNGVWKGEIWNRHKNGEVYNNKLTITAVNNAAGVVTNFIATLTDITISNEPPRKLNNLHSTTILLSYPIAVYY